MQDRRGIQGNKENHHVLMGLPSSEPRRRSRCGELIWHRNNGERARPDLKMSGTRRSQAAWKERMRARTKAMRKVKDKITKCGEREDEEWEAGVRKEDFAELVLSVKVVFGSREAPD